MFMKLFGIKEMNNIIPKCGIFVSVLIILHSLRSKVAVFSFLFAGKNMFSFHPHIAIYILHVVYIYISIYTYYKLVGSKQYYTLLDTFVIGTGCPISKLVNSFFEKKKKQ